MLAFPLSITGTLTLPMRSKTARATIKEVASVAGASTQTVSRVINERPDVSPETRKRVQEVIKALSYQPSALARSLISQRSYTLGVAIAGLKHLGPSRTLSGITSAAEEAWCLMCTYLVRQYYCCLLLFCSCPLIRQHNILC